MTTTEITDTDDADDSDHPDNTDQPGGSDSTGDTAGPATTTMRAVVQDRYGAPGDVLRTDDIDRPTIAADEVLVEVHTAGIDRGVWHIVTGQPLLIRLAGYGITTPKHRTPGLDVAGRVIAVGADVTRLAVGDEVFGIANGSFAEYAAAKERKLVHKPANVTFEAAGVASVSGITALQALTDIGGVAPGQHVLIIGASGGVGSYAVQLAKALGATVTGVAGTRNLDLVRRLGADHVIDHRTEDVAAGDQRYDLVLDIGGRNSVRRLRSVLTRRGTLVIVGGEGGDRITGGLGRQLRALLWSPFVSQRLTTFISKEDHSSIERLATFLATREVVPAIDHRVELDGVIDELREMEAGRISGKSAVTVRSEG